jgi:putative iron-regulated protein
MRAHWLAPAVAACLVATPSAAATSAPPAQALARALEGHARIARAAYAEAVAGAGELRRVVREFLASPSDPTLARARSAWVANSDAYCRTEVFRFSGGPIDDVHPVTGAQGPEGRINAWPIDEAYLDYVVGSPRAGLIADTRVPIAESTLVLRNAADDETQVTLGIHAIEFLLWGQDRSREGPGNRPYTDFLPGDPVRERRRACLSLMVELLVRDLTRVAEEWVPGPGRYATTFLALPPEDALSRAITGPATLAAFELASERIGIPLSTGMQEDELSCFSDNTHRDLTANVEGLERVLEGDGRVPGLLTAFDAAHAGEIRERLERVRRLVYTLPAPFDAMLGLAEEDPRRRTMQALMGELFGLAGAIQRAGEAAGVRVVIGGGG